MNTTSTAVVSTATGPMDVFFARPDRPGPKPGLLLFHEAFGVNDHIEQVSNRLADQGYVVAAPSLFHGFDVRTVPYDDVPTALRLVSELTTDQIITDSVATLGLLKDDPEVDDKRVGAIGFCFGGRCAFLAATISGVAAAVSFYGGGIAGAPPEAPIFNAAQLQAPILLLFGELDPMIPREQRELIVRVLNANGKPFEMIVHPDAGHAFFNDARSENYQEQAAKAAWEKTLSFLDVSLGGGAGR